MPELTQPPQPEMMTSGPVEGIARMVADQAPEMPPGHEEQFNRLADQAAQLDPDQVAAQTEPIMTAEVKKSNRTRNLVIAGVAGATALGLGAVAMRSGKAGEIIGKLTVAEGKFAKGKQWLGKGLAWGRKAAETKGVRFATKPLELGVNSAISGGQKAGEIAGAAVQKATELGKRAVEGVKSAGDRLVQFAHRLNPLGKNPEVVSKPTV